MDEVIDAEGLTKIFNGTAAVDHINFSVGRGEVFGFLGPNGAGKTTTINMLTTILKPTEGHAEICGYDVLGEPKQVRKYIGLVPQEYTADEDLTGQENVILCGDLYGLPRHVSRQRAEELLGLVELLDSKDRKVETYSGGMRRRLELACGLVNRPKLLFLDEPTLGLDVQTRAAVWNYIRLLKEEYDMTIFMTTHYLEEADNLCDMVGIIDYGKIVKLGSPNEMKNSLSGDVMEIGVDDGSADITTLVSGVSGVKTVEKKDTSYRIKLRDGERTAPLIMEALWATGHRITNISLTKPTLDEVYLEYTGRSMRQEAQEGADLFRQRAPVRRVRAHV